MPVGTWSTYNQETYHFDVGDVNHVGDTDISDFKCHRHQQQVHTCILQAKKSSFRNKIFNHDN